jgi:hypothetical protein
MIGVSHKGWNRRIRTMVVFPGWRNFVMNKVFILSLFPLVLCISTAAFAHGAGPSMRHASIAGGAVRLKRGRARHELARHRAAVVR